MTLKRKIEGLIRSYESKVINDMIKVRNGSVFEHLVKDSMNKTLDKIELLKKLLED